MRATVAGTSTIPTQRGSVGVNDTLFIIAVKQAEVAENQLPEGAWCILKACTCVASVENKRSRRLQVGMHACRSNRMLFSTAPMVRCLPTCIKYRHR